MNRGFYLLGSGMVTQSRILSGISNNLANIETTGYKKEEVSSKSFGSILISRIDAQTTPIGKVSTMRVVDEVNTIHSEGTLNNTGRTLDFAIKGQGFFAVQGDNGTEYTRNGSFNVDSEGYLISGAGKRVLGQNGPIFVGSDAITSDSEGGIYIGGQRADKIAIYDFQDYNTLQADGEGMYTTTSQPTLVQNPTLEWKTLEGSNVNAAEEMTDALNAQRSLQSCSQALKMYDSNLEKAVTEISKI